MLKSDTSRKQDMTVGEIKDVTEKETFDAVLLADQPLVTFYKMSYKAYTHFSTETVVQHPVGSPLFGREFDIIPGRVGDLMHKCCLKIEIPSFCIKKSDLGVANLTYEHESSPVADFSDIKNKYAPLIAEMCIIALKAKEATNVDYYDMIADINKYVTQERVQVFADYNTFISKIREKMEADGETGTEFIRKEYLDPLHTIHNSNENELFQRASKIVTQSSTVFANTAQKTKAINQTVKEIVYNDIREALQFTQSFYDTLFKRMMTFRDRERMDKSGNVCFSWAKNLGYSMIEYIEFHIGALKIDKHYGIWMMIYLDLFCSSLKKEKVEHMQHGDTLSVFDYEEKPKKTLYIPLHFWFNRFADSSLPLVSIQHTHVKFVVKLREMNDVCRIENVYKIVRNGREEIVTETDLDYLMNRAIDKGRNKITRIEEHKDYSLYDIFVHNNKSIEASMLIDYIYLDTGERKRFASNNQEYVIDLSLIHI